MKIFKDKNMRKQTIKIIVCAVILAVVQFVFVSGSYITVSDSARRFCIVVELVLGAWIIWTVLSIIGVRGKPLFKNLKDYLKKVLAKVIKPIRDKLSERYNRKRKFIKGSDENKFILNFNLNIIDKLKNKLRLRQKLDLKQNSSNREKIKLLYIKLILILTEKNYQIRYSHTPKEIKDNLDSVDNNILFDIYEQVRYGDTDNIAVSDDMIKMCENITDKIK